MLEQNLYQNDMLCLCSADSGIPTSVFYNRSVVHRDGSFHIGLQAYIIAVINDVPMLLVNRRSNAVDISPLKYDQVAIQMLMEDNLDFDVALSRGLREEVGITQYEAIAVNDTRIKIVKKYSERPDLYNREYVKLFFVTVSSTALSQVSIKTPKLLELLWIPFHEYVSRIYANPTSFTKTAQFYVFNPPLLKLAEQFVAQLTQLRHLNFSMTQLLLENQLSRSEFYQYGDQISLIVNSYSIAQFREILIFEGSSLIHKLGNVTQLVVSDSKQQKELTLEAQILDGAKLQWNSKYPYRLNQI